MNQCKNKFSEISSIFSDFAYFKTSYTDTYEIIKNWSGNINENE